jgi:hypothetical protein
LEHAFLLAGHDDDFVLIPTQIAPGLLAPALN